MSQLSFEELNSFIDGYNDLLIDFYFVYVLQMITCFSFFCLQRPTADGVLRDGHLSLSGLQMRAHAMFSAQGLPLGSDTLEYAWLIDMQAGALTGRVTVPQVGLVIQVKCEYVDLFSLKYRDYFMHLQIISGFKIYL